MNVDPYAVPAPFAFNAWKHHLGFMRASIRKYAAGGESGFQNVVRELLRVGNNTLDIYTGAIHPAEIARLLKAQLRTGDLFEANSYRARLEELGGYMVLDLPDDSQWVLREGDDPDLYIHIHPAKYRGPCRRFRANNIKTAVGVLTRMGPLDVFHVEAVDLKLVNEVRSHFPGLSPVTRLETDTGPGELMRLIMDR